MLIHGCAHEIWRHSADQPVTGTEKSAAWIGATKAPEFCTGDIQRLGWKKSIDKEIRDAVTADESDGFRKLGGAKVPVTAPVGMVEIFKGSAESLCSGIPHGFPECVERGGDRSESTQATMRVV